jgi:hypothetical protein
VSRTMHRTGPTLGLLLIAVGLVVAGLVLSLAGDGLPGADELATALPSAGLVLMVCAAAVVATGRTPAMSEVRGLAWVFLLVVAAAPLVGAGAFLLVVDEPLVLGVVLVAGLSVAVTLTATPSPSRRRPREFTGSFGLVLTGGLIALGLAALLVVLAGAVSWLWLPGILVGVLAVLFLAAPAALLATRRVDAWAPVRGGAAAYLFAVYVLPFAIPLVLARQSWDGLAVWLVAFLLMLLTLAAGAVVVATLVHDNVQRRRVDRRVSR